MQNSKIIPRDRLFHSMISAFKRTIVISTLKKQFLIPGGLLRSFCNHAVVKSEQNTVQHQILRHITCCCDTFQRGAVNSDSHRLVAWKASNGSYNTVTVRWVEACEYGLRKL
ncbi:hypothetical protein DPX39_090065100 [Trypanosoma brucei equiperdum]|uniref:Uncharacterized protein n=1 Tax=Trypanosoma brucei equiperdum TaxID=630700 RepID=A0A3L6L2D3_9TRYP|nr:hypothetical protein DPX39_090065100 [Trypanosoma brucei equiperdum]